MQRTVLDADFRDMLLQVEKVARLEHFSPFERDDIVVQGESHFEHGRILQQVDDGRRDIGIVESEEEADVGCRHLQEGHSVLVSLLEGRPCFGIDAEDRLCEQVVDCLSGLPFGEDDNNSPLKIDSGQRRYLFFIVFFIKYFRNKACFSRNDLVNCFSSFTKEVSVRLGRMIPVPPDNNMQN